LLKISIGDKVAGMKIHSLTQTSATNGYRLSESAKKFLTFVGIFVILLVVYSNSFQGDWFFDDFDRIEPKNNVAYAAQSVLLVQKATGVDLAPLALSALCDVTSWRTGLNANDVFRRHLQRAEKTWAKENQ